MNAVELEKISKRFGNVQANDSINLSVKEGEIHCLLGENGAGKTTLMKILFGLYTKDSGNIYIRGKKVVINGPRQAIELGIGMIHQHFMLVGRMTVVENIIAGDEPKNSFFINKTEALKKVINLSNRYGLKVNPQAKIENISVGEQQRVEILKALYRKAEILILDEPTAVLTPQETEELFEVMKELKNNGKTIIFITHKLKETMAISDRVTILRDGKVVGTVNTGDVTPQKLARMMVGRDVVLRIDKKSMEKGKTVFRVKNLFLHNKKSNLRLENINFDIKEGEILGVAGVEGNGQMELEEGIMGLYDIEKGQIFLRDREISHLSTKKRRKEGIAHIPSDRLKRGLIEEFSIEKNLILGLEWSKPYSKKGFFDKKTIADYSNKIVKKFDIKCPGIKSKVEDLSGGNQQKLIIARELMRDPDFILAAQPTRGVDVGAIEYIHKLLLEMRDKGKGILLISAELDELRSLSDRIVVLYEGKIVAEGNTENFTEEELGLLMAGHKLEGKKYESY